MLSAVAARRAKLQSTNPAGLIEVASSQSSSTKLSPKPSSSLKRRSSQETPKTTRAPSSQNKRPRKRARDESQYETFNTAASQTPPSQNKSLERDQLGVPSDDSSADEDVLEPIASSSNLPSQIVTKQAKLAGQRRAWSPSAPLPDSSDDAANEDSLDADDLDLPNVPFISESSAAKASPAVRLSTFKPMANQNTFHLSLEEVTNLGISSVTSGKATCISMSIGERLTLLGTYDLTVLRGSIILCGLPLFASPRSHRVFAPRSSPLPVIECSMSASLEWVKLANIPKNLLEGCRGEGATILLQESKTGVEGLEKICRTFDGVFTSLEWQGGPDADSLNLPGVQIVLVLLHHLQISVVLMYLYRLHNRLALFYQCIFLRHGRHHCPIYFSALRPVLPQASPVKFML